MVPLSVLDLSPIIEGGDAGQALRNSLDLARHVEALGYQRFWMAEHHNLPGIASAATAVALAHVAAGTNTIRIGFPYSAGAGQNQTFIAGIRGTPVSGGFPVVIDAYGQLGTADGLGNVGIGTANPTDRLQVSMTNGSFGGLQLQIAGSGGAGLTPAASSLSCSASRTLSLSINEARFCSTAAEMLVGSGSGRSILPIKGIRIQKCRK